MSATVVAVVIFLAGVMVGRGVQSPQATLAASAGDAAIDPTVEPPSTSSATTGSGAPVTAQETLTYASRLEGTTPPEEDLAPVTEPVAAPAAVPPPPPAVERAPVPTPAPTRAAAPAAAPAPAAAAASIGSEPPGNGFVVQVAATRERSEADTIARRLAGKGYPAFVTTPPSGPRMFRVRVGKYDNRREAEAIADRLQREEQFQPWITR
ncbi:MAG: SPOR domain-containing protein [Vicinamibacterales bacterium]